LSIERCVPVVRARELDFEASVECDTTWPLMAEAVARADEVGLQIAGDRCQVIRPEDTPRDVRLARQVEYELLFARQRESLAGDVAASNVVRARAPVASRRVGTVTGCV
jgi:hypothetical protein